MKIPYTTKISPKRCSS